LEKIKKLSLVLIVAIVVAFTFNISVAPTNQTKLPKLTLGAVTVKGETNPGVGLVKNSIILSSQCAIELEN
jgi:hypothetical protein